MKGFLHCFFAFLLASLLLACSKNEDKSSAIRAYGFNENTQSIFIEFNTNVINQEIGVIKEREIIVNNQKTKVKYELETPTRLNIFTALKANQKYDIFIDLNDILANEKVQLKVQTPFEKLDIKGYFQNISNDESILILNIQSFYTLNKDELLKAVKITAQEKEIQIDKIIIQGDMASVYSKTLSIKNTNTNVKVVFNKDILGLENNIDLEYILLAKSEFVFQNANIVNKNIELLFSQNISQDQNLKELIFITPKVDFKALAFGNKIKLTGDFSPNKTYEIQLAQGIKSADGISTKENYKTQVSLKDCEPAISFTNQGVFLSSKASKKIAFKSMNIKKVRLEVHQVFSNNLSEYLRYKNLQGAKNLSDYDSDIFSESDYTSEIVLKKDFDIKNAKNQWQENEIALDGLKDLSGVFIVKLYFKEEDVDYVFDEGMESWKKYRFFNQKAKVSKNLIFSDIALIAQNLNKKLFVDVRDFTTQKALGGVKVDVISKSNQVLASKMSDDNGLAVFDDIDESKALFIIASKDKQASILRLSSPLLYDGFDIDGFDLTSQNKVFIYTERGVYRPGDDIYLTMVARNDKGAVNHPIFLTFFDPRNKKLLDKIKLDPLSNGTFYKKISLDQQALSGVYLARVEFANTVFDKEILVQNIVPNRIKVSMQAPKSIKENEKLDFNISSKYLFGTPASNLQYQADLFVSKKEYKNSKYPEYIFSNPSVLVQKYQDNLKGMLDENGFTKQEFTLNDFLKNTPYNLEASIRARVFEKGSRSVEALVNSQVILHEYFVGIKRLKNHYLSSGSIINFEAIVSDLDENLIANREIKYTIYANDYSWWWDYDNYDDFLKSLKKDKNTQIITQGIILSKDKPVKIEFDPKEYHGEMFIELEDVQSKTSTGEFFYISSFGAPSNADIVSSLKIKSDKKEYKPDETAFIEFESVKGAKAIVTLNDNAKVLKRFVIDTYEDITKVEFPILKEYMPNVYVSVILLQDYDQYTNDRALRLFGVVPLNVVDEQSKIELDLKVPDKIMPKQDFEVEIQSKNKQSYTYTVAIVDEGLLDVNAFKTPDIWGYFYQKTRFNMSIYDTYDKIIAKNISNASKVLTTGGDVFLESRVNKSKNDEKARRFKPVVLFQEPVQSDENGYAKLKFNMPSYLGSVRVMVVANNLVSFGSASKDIQVSAPAVMLETLPRALRLDDEFKLLVQVFKVDDDVKNAKLKLKTKNSLINFENDEILIDFGNEKTKDIYVNAKVNSNKLGVEEIELSLNAKDYTYTQNMQIDIKALNTITYEGKSFKIPANTSMEFKITQDYINPVAFLSVSSKPILNINHRLKYLQNYPYGCIEQSTSAVLPQLFLQKLDQGANEQKNINNINALLSKYANFQTANGGFAYWQGLKDSDAWGSNYAGMFMILAKERGYYVSEGMFKAWLDYQKRYVLKAQTNKEIRINSLYLLALAKEPNLSIMNAIYEDSTYLQSLNNVSLWQLSAAYKLAGFDEVALNIAKNLSTKPDEKANYTHTYGSFLRDEAIIANAYKIIYGKDNDELLDDIKKTLEGQAWLSTQSTGYALYALANSFSDESSKTINASVKINGESKKLNASFSKFEFNQGSALIEAKEDTYVHFGVEGIKKGIAEPFAQRMYIERSFYDENGNEIDESTIKSSQIFYMKLKISNKNYPGASNIALTQILPSGWEIVHDLLDDEAPDFVKNSYYDFVDIRDDKIMYFFPLYSDESREFFVKLSAVTPGVYTLSGAYAEAMYDNAYKALSESKRVKVVQ
ncbi:alpha-2-macroglobulin domain-containing protein [Campylobacter lari CCUG 22395]|uniref:alpha-2-macroglobulin domain-containing protein n=1 Tax=Campylobacter lari TaxID=201 RepID=UPI00057DAB55|nr:alpha-2-macroglobulin domain-containing protein [Campylobacter lari]AJD03998.1 alpha-2-macroglobulin domain-containing protein [Campylobacter lari CCUG 22395]